MKALYNVRITRKHPAYDDDPFTEQVSAASKSEANRKVKARLEREGYYFGGGDAATFVATLVYQNGR